MAYDRYDQDERSRWSGDRNANRDNRSQNSSGGSRDDRSFWDRASDEVSSWFGDDDAERRREQDHRRDQRESGSGRHASGSHDRDYDRGYGRDYDRDRATYNRDQSSYGGGRSDRDFNYDRGVFNRGGSSDRDYNPNWRSDLWGSSDRDHDRERNQSRNQDRNRSSDRAYRPITGDYGREGHESDQFFAASGYGRNDYGRSDFGSDRNRSEDRDRDYDRSQTPYGRDQYRRTSFAGSREGNRDTDAHYNSWRDRHMSELDRDYDDYRREHQSKFENEFGSWREKRQQKRGLLSQIHEHMDVVGNDDKHVGTVDKVAGDRIILTKSDPDSGGHHHSLSCSDVDCVKDGKVILDCSADEAKKRWRDEDRSRALFEREDQGEMGPRNLNRSFEGTYR
jgi:hypothetical protein